MPKASHFIALFGERYAVVIIVLVKNLLPMLNEQGHGER